jgi:hypothetical protein
MSSFFLNKLSRFILQRCNAATLRTAAAVKRELERENKNIIPPMQLNEKLHGVRRMRGAFGAAHCAF